jgi:hypothetical protein
VSCPIRISINIGFKLQLVLQVKKVVSQMQLKNTAMTLSMPCLVIARAAVGDAQSSRSILPSMAWSKTGQGYNIVNATTQEAAWPGRSFLPNGSNDTPFRWDPLSIVLIGNSRTSPTLQSAPLFWVHDNYKELHFLLGIPLEFRRTFQQ